MLIAGKSQTGKTSLSADLIKSSNVLSLDHHLLDIVKYERSELANFIKPDFSRYQLAQIYQKIDKSGFVEEYSQAVLESLPDSDLIFIEGWGLSLANIQKNIIDTAKYHHYRVWAMGRM